MMRWLCVGLGILGFVVAYRLSGGNLLTSLSLALAPITALVGIERGLATEKERKASSLTEQQFMLHKAGGAQNLRRQALFLRTCGYLFFAIGLPLLIVGVVAAAGGSMTGLFIALGAAVVVWGAKIFLNVAGKMRAAANGAQ